MAKLHFKYGAMNSGKSDSLIKTAYNYTEMDHNVVTIKPAIDTKGDNRIIARGGHERQADILADEEMDLRKAVTAKNLGETALRCVLVDEAQFLTAEQIGQLRSIADPKEKGGDDISVVAFGLRTDFKTKLFEGSKRLMELADNIEKLPTMCRCGDQAEFNVRQVDNTPVFEGDQVAIDGEAHITYTSMCSGCYTQAGGTI